MNNPTSDPNDTTIKTEIKSTKNQWKDIGNVSGIYKIVNKIDGKYYVGSTKNFNERINRHFKSLRRGKHHNINLQRSFDKYGEESFEFVVLETCEVTNLLTLEQLFLNKLKPFLSENGYNINQQTSGSDNWRLHPRRNELIKNHSIRFSGNRNPNYGKHHSEETKRLIAKNSVKVGSSNGRWKTVSEHNTSKIIEEFNSNGLNSAKRMGKAMGFGWRVVYRILNHP